MEQFDLATLDKKEKSAWIDAAKEVANQLYIQRQVAKTIKLVSFKEDNREKNENKKLSKKHRKLETFIEKHDMEKQGQKIPPDDANVQMKDDRALNPISSIEGEEEEEN